MLIIKMSEFNWVKWSSFRNWISEIFQTKVVFTWFHFQTHLFFSRFVTSRQFKLECHMVICPVCVTYSVDTTCLYSLLQKQFCIVICRVSAMRAMFMLKTQFHDLLNMLNVFWIFRAMYTISWQTNNNNKHTHEFRVRFCWLDFVAWQCCRVYYSVLNINLFCYQ